jgi:hypothetical protein
VKPSATQWNSPLNWRMKINQRPIKLIIEDEGNLDVAIAVEEGEK